MRLSVLGGSGAWPVPGQGCSGYLVAEGDTLLLLDPGPGTLGDLLVLHAAHEVSAVLVSHGHADHTVDLAALLRARRMADQPAPALSVYAPVGALDAVLALDPPGVVSGSVTVLPVGDGADLDMGGLHVSWRSLPHHVPNLGMRLRSGDGELVYTGDTGPSTAVESFAAGADVLLADATYLSTVPDEDFGLLGSAIDAGRTATRAGVGRLVLTHLWPGTDPAEAAAAARREFSGPIDVARPGLVLTVGPSTRSGRLRGDQSAQPLL